MVFMNHEAPPSIAIDIQSWVRFGSGQLAISLERWTMPNLAGDFEEARNGRSVVGDSLLLLRASPLRRLKRKVSTARLPETPIQIFVSGCMSMSGRTARQVRFHLYS